MTPPLRLLPVLLLSGLLAAGCGETVPAAAGTMDREVFIATYVDLRVAALHGSGELTDAQRTEILERHGVTEDELTAFVDVHGPDVTFMREVWNEVEARLDATRSRPDTAGAP